MTMTLAKAAAEGVLARPPVTWLGRRRTRARRLVLAYHNVVPDGTTPAGDTSLHLGLSDFARHMDHLLAHTLVVPLDRMLQSEEPRNDNRLPLVAITFDDAYRGAVTFGTEITGERGMDVTIFVAPGLLGRGPFWWDLLRWPADARAAGRIRNHALRRLGGRRDRVLDWARRLGPGVRSVPVSLLPASEREVVTAGQRRGVTLGSHTWSHLSLPRLDRRELRRELTRSCGWVKRRAHRFVPWVSYPYGHHSARIRDEAARAGYEGGMQVSGGWFSVAETDQYAVPRLNIPAGISLDGFKARVAGFLGDR